MTAYGIIGDVEASPKLVRAALSDLLEAHVRSTPDDEFWLTIGVRNAETKIHDEMLNWAARNEVYTEVVTPSANYEPFVPPAALTVSPSFMLDVVEKMHHAEGGKILALVGDQTPRTDVLRALAKAKDNGTEIRDLAEAGLTLILFKGDDPPPYDNDSEEETMAEEEVEATLAELGEYADDTDDEETAEEAQRLLLDAAEEHGLDPDAYPTWVELAEALQELSGEAPEPEAEAEPLVEGLTREALVGKEISEIKALAKAAGIEGYSKMRREPLITALLGEAEESPPATTPPAKKAAGAAKTAAKGSVTGNGDATVLTDADVERVADAVVTRLATALSSG
jgi:Rho termination factor, N-terminal domain